MSPRADWQDDSVTNSVHLRSKVRTSQANSKPSGVALPLPQSMFAPARAIPLLSIGSSSDARYGQLATVGTCDPVEIKNEWVAKCRNSGLAADLTATLVALSS